MIRPFKKLVLETVRVLLDVLEEISMGISTIDEEYK